MPLSTEELEPREHECDKQGYRIAEFDIIFGGGWFIDADYQKVIGIHYCPYCGTMLDRDTVLTHTTS